MFPDSRVDRVTKAPAESPGGPPGSVVIVDVTLAGQAFVLMSAAPIATFNHSISFIVDCRDQAEVDRCWKALLEGGGREEQCGWLKDRYGVSWQVVPSILAEMVADADRERAARAMTAMLQMVKIDIAGLKRAFAGE